MGNVYVLLCDKLLSRKLVLWIMVSTESRQRKRMVPNVVHTAETGAVQE